MAHGDSTAENRAATPSSPWPAIWPPLLILVGGAVVIALVLLDGPPVIRAVTVLTYLGAVPGLALVRLVRLPDRLMEFVIAVALSLALGILVAEAMLALEIWSPLLGLSALVAIASGAALFELTWPGRLARGSWRTS